MPRELDSPFKLVEFDQQESFLAFIFTDLQLAHIKNECAVAMVTRAKLAEDPENPQKYLLEQAYLRGTVEAYELLVKTHLKAKHELSMKLGEELEEQEVSSQVGTSEAASFGPQAVINMFKTTTEEKKE